MGADRRQADKGVYGEYAVKQWSYVIQLSVLFVLLCLTWTFNGFWLAIGNSLHLNAPSLVGTFLFVLVSLCILYSPMLELRIDWKRWRVPQWLLILIMAFYVAQYHFGQANRLLASLPLFLSGLSLAFLAVVFWLKRRHKLGVTFFLALVTLLAIQSIESLSWAQVPAMLVWVANANYSLIGGHNPYIASGLNYFPVLWLSYLPAAILSLDPRVMNILFLVLVSLVWLQVSERLFLKQFPDFYFAGILGCVVLFLNPGVVQESIKDQVLPDWIYISLFVAGLVLTLPTWSAAGLGLSIAGRQTSLVLLPFALTEFAQRFRYGVRWFVLGIGVAALFILPFLLWNPNAFIGWTFFFNEQWGLQRWAQDRAQANAFSLAAPFFVAGIPQLLQVIQVVLVGTLLVLFTRVRTTTISGSLSRFAIVYLIFLLFNPMIWNYYYIEFFILVLAFIFSRLFEIAGADGQQAITPTYSDMSR
jgi:hypothetical protein